VVLWWLALASNLKKRKGYITNKLPHIQRGMHDNKCLPGTNISHLFYRVNNYVQVPKIIVSVFFVYLPEKQHGVESMVMENHNCHIFFVLLFLMQPLQRLHFSKPVLSSQISIFKNIWSFISFSFTKRNADDLNILINHALYRYRY
jgi:hypothetical protein